ncbi:hypothetical protein [Isobaculum melis]|uniref:Uncharacterized protein n=1 Tax=Isobaculum melis TaxID=142588 RepID=A0A1H9PXI5_9LACT|nr:hypothetical protein [Isobaculum melis]SER52941.1 hypothetical protein SAMN04488559_101216 [Isobaculum melis]
MEWIQLNKKSADIYREAIEYIYRYFEKDGYKLLKNNVIKKRDHDFVYEITFSSSHYNYIDFHKKVGSVKLHIHCDIILNKSSAYRFFFIEPQNRAPFIELLDNQLKIRYEFLDSIMLDVDKHFLKVIEKIKNNPKDFLLKELKLMPEGQSKDYSYQWCLNRSLVDYYGDDSMLCIYDKNKQVYKEIANIVHRISQEHYICMKSKGRINEVWCERMGQDYFYDITKKVKVYKKKTNSLSEYDKERFKEIMAMKNSNVTKLAVISRIFCLDLLSDSRLETSDLKKEIQQLCENVLY